MLTLNIAAVVDYACMLTMGCNGARASTCVCYVTSRPDALVFISISWPVYIERYIIIRERENLQGGMLNAQRRMTQQYSPVSLTQPIQGLYTAYIGLYKAYYIHSCMTVHISGPCVLARRINCTDRIEQSKSISNLSTALVNGLRHVRRCVGLQAVSCCDMSSVNLSTSTSSN